MIGLPAPPSYFPPADGRYVVAPGIVKLGRDCGGGKLDQQVFQFDHHFSTYRQAKLAALTERAGRYVCRHDLTDAVERAASGFICKRLLTEHSQWFARRDGGLDCRLTGEFLPAEAISLDTLSLQIQEDLAIMSTAGRRHWVSYLHLCFPNRWAATDKIGGSFARIHEPVAGMEQMNHHGDRFAAMMVGASEPLVRFAWGITFDDRLNQHPQTPRKPFDPGNPAAWLRVERQTICGLPAVGAAIFTVRTYLYDVRQLPAERRLRLAEAVETMPAESARYKGLADCREALVAWLRSPTSAHRWLSR